jgi:AraC-like DNA-binding protein
MPLGSRLVCETEDLLAARDHLSRFLWPHSVIPTAPRQPVAFRHCEARIGRVSLHALHYGAAVKIDARPGDGSYLFLILLNGEGELSQGKFTGPLNPQIVRPMNPTGVATMRFSRGEINLTLRIPGTVLKQALAEETGRAITAPIEFQQQTDPSTANAPGLRRYLEFVCAEFDRRARSAENQAVLRQMERTIVSLVLTQLPHNYSDALGGEPLGPAPDYIRTVEEYIAASAEHTLSLQNLAAVAGVSERTLQSAFRRYRDTTPMEFLRDYRLELARRGLEKAAMNGRSVTEIALSCGFNHLGKFAKCYRARFGETPSETRRRALPPTN